MNHSSITIVFFVLFSIAVQAINDDRLALSFPKAEILNSNTTRIPFKIVDQLIMVEAELQNQKGNFIVDTGSMTLILNSVHFKATPSHFNTNDRFGVNGDVHNVKERILKAFKINHLILDKLNADVIDLSHFEKLKRIKLLGIIGYNVLKDYEVFIDMHLNQITLSKLDKKGERLTKKVYAEKIADSVAFKLKKHSIVLETYIENHKLKFALDTGAEYNQINKRLNSKILKYFYPSKRQKLYDASGNKIEVLAGKLYRVRLKNSIYFGPMKTILTNLNKMNEAFGTHIDGILGFEFFAQKRTIINYKKQKLYFIDNPVYYH